MQLENFDAAVFLRDYWQKKPVLLRQALPFWQNPLEPDDLAGLACEDTVESRIIAYEDSAYVAQHGPFDAEDFTAYDQQPWTLLVQAVDHYVPQVAALLSAFAFIPHWRIDDVMVSYANKGGGVGPHFDQYDVFLVQASGTRRWQVGGACDQDTALMPHDAIKLLAQFEPQQQWDLEAGDILYIPPGIAHNGVALDDACMTYSVGFRAPSTADLISEWADYQIAILSDDQRYTDPGLALQNQPGLIADAAIAKLQAQMMAALSDSEGFARWLGQHLTVKKYPDTEWQRDDTSTLANYLADFKADFKAGGQGELLITCNAASRFAYIQNDDQGVTLFADGAAMDCSAAVAPLIGALCDDKQMLLTSAEKLSAELYALLSRLHENGSITLHAAA